MEQLALHLESLELVVFNKHNHTLTSKTNAYSQGDGQDADKLVSTISQYSLKMSLYFLRKYLEKNFPVVLPCMLYNVVLA